MQRKGRSPSSAAPTPEEKNDQKAPIRTGRGLFYLVAVATAAYSPSLCHLSLPSLTLDRGDTEIIGFSWHHRLTTLGDESGYRSILPKVWMVLCFPRTGSGLN